MNGERDNPNDSVAYTIPQLAAPESGFDVGTLADYMGIPPIVTPFHVNALPFRAYNLIWNSWFRDENLQDSVRVNVDDTGDVPADFTLLRRGKRHDYFTSCLPWPQKGDAVQVSIGGTANVALKSQTGINSRVVNATDHNPMGGDWDYVIGKNDGNMYHGTGSSTSKVVIDPNGSLR